MTKPSSKRKKIFSFRVISNFAFALFFAVQPSAHAFGEIFQVSAVSHFSALNDGQPSTELFLISNKSLLQTALHSIEHESASLRLPVSTFSSPIISIHSYENRHRGFTRLVFASPNSQEGYPYQGYELTAEKSLGRLIETGKMLHNQFIRERVYDYQNQTVTLFNSKNIFEKRIYELKENGEPGRPFQYRGRTDSGDLVNIRFLYQGKTVTCLHMRGMSFTTYELSEDGMLGNLVEMGMAQGISRAGELEARTRIKISVLLREGQEVPVYIFEESNGTSMIRERQSATSEGLGAIGRILRFVSAQSDLEYFYDDAPSHGVSKVKVLNHRIGESLIFEVPKNELNDLSGRLESHEERQRHPAVKAISNPMPSLYKDTQGVFTVPTEKGHLPLYVRLNDVVLIWEKLLRGPPAFQGKTFDSFPASSSSFLSSVFSFLFSNSVLLSGVLA